jgi:hypothetical protein
VLFYCWWMLADVANSKGVEMGMSTRLSSIQFEVTPGPFASQSIRAARWNQLRSLGDLHDWLMAAVENLYSDDDRTYFTTVERAPLKAAALVQTYQNEEFSQIWRAAGIDTDPARLRGNCSASLPSVATLRTNPVAWVPTVSCAYLQRCAPLLSELRQSVLARVVVARGYAVGDDGSDVAAAWDLRVSGCADQRCAAGWQQLVLRGCASTATGLTGCSDGNCRPLFRIAALGHRCQAWLAKQPFTQVGRPGHATLSARKVQACAYAGAGPTDAQCAAAAATGVAAVPSATPHGQVLRTHCESISGCRYWRELWREECIAGTSVASRQRRAEVASARGAVHEGNLNLFNTPVPWLVLRMRRSSADIKCADVGGSSCFAQPQGPLYGHPQFQEDTTSWVGEESGFVYHYNAALQGFPFFLRLDDTSPDRWVGLLEMLRADRWLSETTYDVSLGCVTLNSGTRTVGHWELHWVINSGGQVTTPDGMKLRSFPLAVADPAERSGHFKFVLGLVISLLSIDAATCLINTYRTTNEMLRRLVQQAREEYSWHTALLQRCVLLGNAMLVLAMLVTTVIWFLIDDMDISPHSLRLTDIKSTLHGFVLTGDSADLKRRLDYLVSLQHSVESWVLFRAYFGLFCIYTVARCIAQGGSWLRVLHVIYKTAATKHLSGFLVILVASAIVFALSCHLMLGRRFFYFRSMMPSLLAVMGPVVGGNSWLEDAVSEAVMDDPGYTSLILFMGYALYLIFLVYNVLIAILVDGYEEAKDVDERMSQDKDESGISKINMMFDEMMVR